MSPYHIDGEYQVWASVGRRRSLSDWQCVSLNAPFICCLYFVGHFTGEISLGRGGLIKFIVYLLPRDHVSLFGATWKRYSMVAVYPHEKANETLATFYQQHHIDRCLAECQTNQHDNCPIHAHSLTAQDLSPTCAIRRDMS